MTCPTKSFILSTESFRRHDAALDHYIIICWPPSSAWPKGISEVVIMERQLLYTFAALNLINSIHLAMCMLR